MKSVPTETIIFILHAEAVLLFLQARIVPLAQIGDELQPFSVFRLLFCSHAGRTGRKALGANATAFESPLILHHIGSTVLATAPHRKLPLDSAIHKNIAYFYFLCNLNGLYGILAT